MPNELWNTHLQRLRVGASHSNDTTLVPEWLEKNTTLLGKPFSFKDHEWQLGPLKSTAREIVLIKPSQVGASELSARWALARVAMIKGYTCIYVMPSASFARAFAKTRVDNIINDSPFLRNAVDRNVDSTDVKKFGGSSFLWFKGAQAGSQAISVPASCVLVDEYDFGMQDVISTYTSRLTHSEWRHKIFLSTPTIPGFGIADEFEHSRKHYRMCKCDGCNTWYWPDFFRDCKIPGHPDANLHKITPAFLAKYPYRDAIMVCPKCGKPADHGYKHREWVLSNTDSTAVADGFHLLPWDVPKYNTPDYVIEAATKFTRRQDWINFTLGQPSDDSEACLSMSELQGAIIEAHPGTTCSRVMGLDLGLDSYCVIASVFPDQTVVIEHIEAIPIEELISRREELVRQYRVRASVVDTMPYVESVIRMQHKDPNLYGAIYVRSKATETHTVKIAEEDKERGKLNIKAVHINRDKAFDELMDAVRYGTLKKVSDESDDLWMAHAVDMKRIREFDNNNEMVFSWRKSKMGIDHAWHATLYAFTAAKLLTTVSSFGGSLPLLSTFKVRPTLSHTP